MSSKMLNPLLVQQALRAGIETLASLNEKYGINANRHSDWPNLVQLKYDMIDSPMGEPLVQQCRGLILDEQDNWRVIARPFDKFFNYGEGHAAEINWQTARVQEKVDGSLIIMYHYDGKWRVATSGMPDAGGEVNGFDMTFEKYFWDTFEKTTDVFPAILPTDEEKDLTFMFELSGPENRIVVRQYERKITLLGVRDNITGLEHNPQLFALMHHWPCVKEFPLSSMDDVVASFTNMDPLRQEGYVIVDQFFNRIKVKHPGYVAIHHMRGEGALTPKRVLSIIRSGETDEVLANFPEWKDSFIKVGERYRGLIIELESAYKMISDIPIQKDFALKAVKIRCSAALFQLRSGRVTSVQQSLAAMNIENLVEILDLKSITL